MEHRYKGFTIVKHGDEWMVYEGPHWYPSAVLLPTRKEARMFVTELQEAKEKHWSTDTYCPADEFNGHDLSPEASGERCNACGWYIDKKEVE